MIASVSLSGSSSGIASGAKGFWLSALLRFSVANRAWCLWIGLLLPIIAIEICNAKALDECWRTQICCQQDGRGLLKYTRARLWLVWQGTLNRSTEGEETAGGGTVAFWGRGQGMYI